MAVRGGRMPRWGKPLVQALGLTPIAKIKPDGRLRLAGGLFGKRRRAGALRRATSRAASIARSAGA